MVHCIPNLSSESCSYAFTNLVYVPPGDYGMSTWAHLVGGQNWAFQLDGIIYRTRGMQRIALDSVLLVSRWLTDDRTQGGHMIHVDKGKNFEFYSSTSKGAIQGYGYETHKGTTCSAAELPPLTCDLLRRQV